MAGLVVDRWAGERHDVARCLVGARGGAAWSCRGGRCCARWAAGRGTAAAAAAACSVGAGKKTPGWAGLQFLGQKKKGCTAQKEMRREQAAAGQEEGKEEGGPTPNFVNSNLV